MSETPAASLARRIASVVLPFVVVGIVAWVLVDFSRFKSPPSAATAPAGGGGSAIAGMAARMLGNSTMLGIITASQRKAIEQEVGGILTELKFTDDQRARFIDILTANEAIVMEASLQRMTGKLSATEDEQLRRKVEEANDSVLASAEAFFAKEFPGDPAKFAAFQHHSALAPDRAEVAALQKRLTAANRALTPEQERGLAEVMHSVRSGVVPALDPEDLSLLVLSAETLAPRIRDQQRIDALLRTKAAAVLDAAQVTLLAEHQADRLKGLQLIVDQAPKKESK